ncbi:DUF3943 domain-containing protein [Parabacteroides sp. PF5-9]|uniref:DUF3943 domain-containing protein n=1 Tax=Parabacteroides sp. PF5-9 TaxID=1742404 RepID=UPI0024761D06|nr:DUF3943 domain-containing protein [Parabacteroides sp. PF5-9]MDH6357517.1 hypothetical protein [Parabacteroides sp. PF5-9]
MMRRGLFLFFFVISCCTLYAQIGIRKLTSMPRLPDSVDVVYHSKKNGLLAGSMVFGVNMAVWTFDRYIQKGDFAYINGHTIKENFKHGFIWDNDQMGTNMFLHPYHGSLYYNSARSNGYNYWQSGLFAFAGSWMWEMFMECEYPSTNDIIATPIGGMALGEMLYRTTDLILDDRKTGNTRVGRELSVFLLSPTRGLTRLINGDAWRKRPTSGKQFGVPQVYVEFSIGVRTLELRDEIFDAGMGVASEINIEYGDRFDSDDRKPYDYFSVKASLNGQTSQPMLGQLNIIGRLIGTDIWDDQKKYLSVGLYQHFDYYDSDTISDVSAKTPYKFCTPASFGIGVIYQSKRFKWWDIDAFGHLNGILLGGAFSDYYRVDDRNYNLASGFSTKVGFNFIYKKGKFAASTLYEVYRMYTWKGYPGDIDWTDFNSKTLDAQGDRSKAILHAVSLRLDLRLKKNFYLTTIGSTYSRETNYKNFETVTSTTGEGRLMLTYKF